MDMNQSCEQLSYDYVQNGVKIIADKLLWIIR